MDLLAKIKGIKYKPFLCRDLEVFEFSELGKALASSASFILKINKENRVAKVGGFRLNAPVLIPTQEFTIL